MGLTIGNKVNSSVDNIMAKVYNVQGYLSLVGIMTPVSIVHTWVNVHDNPALCGANFVGVNTHAFYDGGHTSGQAGEFVFKTVVAVLKAACPGRKIHITESGWPSRGRSNGIAIASLANECNALLNLNCTCQDDKSILVYAFEYNDQDWKANDNERSFGISGKFNLLGNVFPPC
ncbi:putative family 17 glucosidase SCW11 [Termitomyces sp. J132]|nr:putative family 17 glucosidase SCW11 [Termitomyces sp. J132]